jgi:translation initiation factor IF-3
VPTDDAMNRARELGLDLVEVAPTERPPVCRIMDYGKWKYQQKKKHKGKQSHEVQIKEVRIRPKTDENDRKIKMNRAHKFLGEGDKVQFTMIFRGRERFHLDRGLAMLKTISTELEQIAKVERFPKMEGRRMTMLLAPLKIPSKPKSSGKAKAKARSAKAEAEPETATAVAGSPEAETPATATPPVVPGAAPTPEPRVPAES